jgi:hypothetical protein
MVGVLSVWQHLLFLSCAQIRGEVGVRCVKEQTDGRSLSEVGRLSKDVWTGRHVISDHSASISICKILCGTERDIVYDA